MDQTRNNFSLTRGEELWLWRKRRRQSISVAAAELKMGRGAFMLAERLDGLERQPELDSPPTANEVMRLLRRRSGIGTRALAQALEISHVTWLKFERSDPPDPRLRDFWNRFDWSAASK